MHDVTFLAALIAGLVSFLSPCVLPLVPPYLIFLAGTSLERFADREPEPRVKRETVLAALLFVAGFSTVFVALGATAVTSLMGKPASISSLRGRKLELADGAALLVTVHPSYLLRMPDRAQAAIERKRFEDDLRAVKAFIDKRGDEVRRGGPLADRAA